MAQKLRVLLDTNVYGYLLDQAEREWVDSLRGSDQFVFYGFKVIRQELRAIPRHLLHGNRNYRSLALGLYDHLVKERGFGLDSLVEALAGEYARAYRGRVSKQKLRNDFLVVACATLHRLDILVSDDEKTMLSGKAREAYREVNKRFAWPQPKFYTITEFRKRV